MNNTVILPAGHQWVEDQTSCNGETFYECNCGALYVHGPNRRLLMEGDTEFHEIHEEKPSKELVKAVSNAENEQRTNAYLEKARYVASLLMRDNHVPTQFKVVLESAVLVGMSLGLSLAVEQVQPTQ